MKKRRLKKWVRTTFSIICGTLMLVVGLYVFFGAVLQESYKLDPPTSAEITELKQSVYFYLADGLE